MRNTETIRAPKRVLLSLFAICVILVIMRQIPFQTTAYLWIDKIAHFSGSWLLAVIFLWVSQTRYQMNGQQAKKTAFLWVIFLGMLWEIAELFDLKAADVFAFPGVQNGWLNYGIDIALDLIFDACGALWYLYAPEMFLSFSDSDPVP